MLFKEIGNIKATIDVQKTAAYYERLSFPQIENSSGANFAANLQLRSAGIRHYLSAFGVDYRKYQDLEISGLGCYANRSISTNSGLHRHIQDLWDNPR